MKYEVINVANIERLSATAMFSPSRWELNQIAVEQLRDLRITEVRASVGNVIDSLNFLWSNIDHQMTCQYQNQFKLPVKNRLPMRVGGIEFGVHNWVGLNDGLDRRQLCTLRLYDESISPFAKCCFDVKWDENETVVFNVAPTENIVSIR